METILFALSILLGVLLAGAVGFVAVKVHWVSKALKSSQRLDRLGEEEDLDNEEEQLDDEERL